jgi:hypothetical protein
VASALREAMARRRGRRHRGRWWWCYVGVDGGDDGAEGGSSVEGGSGKLGSLMAQNQIFTVS